MTLSDNNQEDDEDSTLERIVTFLFGAYVLFWLVLVGMEVYNALVH